jgi:hypothetical protein
VEAEAAIDHFNWGASEALAAYARGVINDFEQVDEWFNEHLLNGVLQN